MRPQVGEHCVKDTKEEEEEDRIVLVASVVVILVFMCIGICHQQSGDWREIIRLSSRPCFPSLTF